jgi:hypothetical protein
VELNKNWKPVEATTLHTPSLLNETPLDGLSTPIAEASCSHKDCATDPSLRPMPENVPEIALLPRFNRA